MDEISHSMETYENSVDSHGIWTLIKLTQAKKKKKKLIKLFLAVISHQ